MTAALLIGGIVAALLVAKNKGVSGIGATHHTITGKVVSVKYRNTSYYGNNSYWVILETETGTQWAYTAANSSLGYTIQSMEGQTVTFDATRRKDGNLVLNHSIGYKIGY